MEYLDKGLLFMGVYAVYLVGKQLLDMLPPLDIGSLYCKDKPNPYVLQCNDMTINNKLNPHTIIVGNSGSGKSKLAEYLVKDRIDIDVTLINCYPDDFVTLPDAKRITEVKEAVEYLENVLTTVHEIPLYLIVDEVLALSMQDKKINKLLTTIIAKGRHHGVFLIVIAQYGTREELPFKNLVGNRIAFNMIEVSNYNTILGYQPESPQLRPREFYFLTTTKGKSRCPLLKEYQQGS